MSIYCPVCRSSNISHHPISQPNSYPANQLGQLASFSALGVAIAKQTSMVNPLLGGLAGILVGGLFGASQPAPTPVLYVQRLCNDCGQQF